MTTTNLGRVAIVPKGTYTAGPNKPLDLVRYNGASYLAKTTTSALPTVTTDWDLIAGDGASLYTWIKYADDSIGTGLSDSPVNKLFIGIAVNKTSATESTTASDYAWSQIKGDKGDTGDTGDTGASADAAAASASAASSSASAASSSASNAASSASTATTQAGIATTQASLATTNGAAQVALATTQATNASTSATTATTQAGIATTQATNAASSATAAAASYDSFDDRYLGSKASDPTLGNDGNALLTGALYWNSPANVMKVYNGGAWSVAYVSASSTGASIRPSLLLDFANSKTLDPRITFTRASTATYTGYDGLIKTATSGSPRFDHNPTTGESLGLLIEEARTNLLTYSENFDNAAWVKYGTCTVTANTTTAPDGTVTADSVVLQNSSGIYQNQTSVITGNITCSIWLKAETNGTTVRLLSDTNLFDFTYITCNLTTGWQRFSITRSLSAGTTHASLQLDTISTAGAVIYAWGAQLEAGAFPTSYIPTVASQATRAADNAVMTGTNFSSWYRQDEGTVFVKERSALTSALNVIHIDDGTNNNRIALQTVSLSQQDIITSNGVNGVQILPTGSISTIASNQLVFAYKTNDASAATNGNIVTTDDTCSIPPVNTLRFGGNSTTVQLNGHIAKFAYYPKRLTNSELQGLTTT